MAFDSDVRDPQYYDFYGPAKPGPSHHEREAWFSKDWRPRPDGKFLEDWLARTCELVDRYQLQLVYFDWWIEQAIYVTRPWKVYGEGPTEVIGGAFQDTKRAGFTAQDVRFATRGDVLYAIVLSWPESGEAMVRSLGAGLDLYPDAIGRVELLGAKGQVQWSRDADGLKVQLPARKPADAAYALKISR
jgi:alpha-L-fucosidase